MSGITFPVFTLEDSVPTSPEQPNGPNPWHPFRDAWDKQAKENPPIFETSREWHDHLSALTWTEEPKKEGNN